MFTTLAYSRTSNFAKAENTCGLMFADQWPVTRLETIGREARVSESAELKRGRARVVSRESGELANSEEANACAGEDERESTPSECREEAEEEEEEMAYEDEQRDAHKLLLVLAPVPVSVLPPAFPA